MNIRLWQLLADRGWHDAYIIRERLADSVTPGVAFRYTELVREFSAARRNAGVARPRRVPLDEAGKAKAVRSGQIAMAHRAMTISSRVGRVQLELADPGDRDPAKLTRADWQTHRPIRIRWTAGPYGLVVDPASDQADRLNRIVEWHADKDGVCAECGNPAPCRTYRAAAGLADDGAGSDPDDETGPDP